MVALNRIYTKTGDDGTTGLGDGSRHLKSAPRLHVIGAIDETNSSIGLARLYTQNHTLDGLLARIQNDLFDLGADLCMPQDVLRKGTAPLRIIATQVERLEQEIDLLNERLQPLRSFILPGGTPLAAHLHQARTLARRAERDLVFLMQQPQQAVSAAALRYINRLSDLLFVAARTANDLGQNDVLWIPGAHR